MEGGGSCLFYSFHPKIMLIDYQQERYHESLSESNFWLFVCVLLHFKIGLQIGRRFLGWQWLWTRADTPEIWIWSDDAVHARYHSPPQYSTTIQYFILFTTTQYFILILITFSYFNAGQRARCSFWSLGKAWTERKLTEVNTLFNCNKVQNLSPKHDLKKNNSTTAQCLYKCGNA